MTVNKAKATRDGALGVGVLAVIELVDAYRDIPDRAETALLGLGLVAIPFVWRILRRQWPALDPTEPA